MRTFIAILAAGAVVLLPAGASAADFQVGLHVQNTILPAQAQRLAIGGTDVIRQAIYRTSLQPNPTDPLDFTAVDAYVEAAAGAGMDVLPVLQESPADEFDDPQHVPRSGAERTRFLAFVQAMVQRYGPTGTFWADHPAVPFKPIRTWQAWNEPNLPKHWDDKPNPGQYVRLLGLMHDTITSADPGAKIMLAGMPEHHHIPSEDMSHYLEKLYDVKGFEDDFDIAAIHSYTRQAKGAVSSVRKIRGIMDAAGDKNAQIWITEFGWADGGPDRHPTVTTQQGQAKQLADSFRLLSSVAAKYRLTGAVWFWWQDPIVPAGLRDRFWFHSGLFTADGQPKPAWQRFAEFTGGDPGTGGL